MYNNMHPILLAVAKDSEESLLDYLIANGSPVDARDVRG